MSFKLSYIHDRKYRKAPQTLFKAMNFKPVSFRNTLNQRKNLLTTEKFKNI